MERPGQQPAAGDHRRPGQRHPAPEHRRPGPAAPPPSCAVTRRSLKAYNGTLGDEGMVPMAFLQELLELEAIYVGEARLNIARPGQNPSLIRPWGPHASFISDRLADTRNGTTFGLTGQWGDRVSGSIADPNIGLRGGQRVRVGESVKDSSPHRTSAFFFENAVAA
ncbi:hypothetical protein P4204_00045 [Pseudomonas aeruginosa]|nr:hypothetical protein [Pseudomonas aeruginosa]